jgi:hypothetical protein
VVTACEPPNRRGYPGAGARSATEPNGSAVRRSGSTAGRAALSLSLPWTPFSDYQFSEAGHRVSLPRKGPFREKDQEHFCCRAHHAIVANVTADYVAPLIRHAHMQMCAVRRDGASERKDLQVAIQSLRLLLSSQSQSGLTETADACNYEGSTVLARIQLGLQRSA